MAIANIAASLISVPPGSDICDVYLLDHQNAQLFEAKQDYRHFSGGSRENMKSGVAELEWGAGQNLYIGIKNPSASYGIHALIEVVAIVLEEEYEERMVSVPNVTTYEVPYLKN